MKKAEGRWNSAYWNNKIRILGEANKKSYHAKENAIKYSQSNTYNVTYKEKSLILKMWSSIIFSFKIYLKCNIFVKFLTSYIILLLVTSIIKVFMIIFSLDLHIGFWNDKYSFKKHQN